jgi:hypothetical protein
MFIPVLPALALGLDTTILIRSQVCSVVSFAGAEQGRGEFLHGSLGRCWSFDCKQILQCRLCNPVVDDGARVA